MAFRILIEDVGSHAMWARDRALRDAETKAGSASAKSAALKTATRVRDPRDATAFVGWKDFRRFESLEDRIQDFTCWSSPDRMYPDALPDERAELGYGLVLVAKGMDATRQAHGAIRMLEACDVEYRTALEKRKPEDVRLAREVAKDAQKEADKADLAARLTRARGAGDAGSAAEAKRARLAQEALHAAQAGPAGAGAAGGGRGTTGTARGGRGPAAGATPAAGAATTLTQGRTKAEVLSAPHASRTRAERGRFGLCMACAGQGHMAAACTNPPVACPA
jgi:hypothetical protein